MLRVPTRHPGVGHDERTGPIVQSPRQRIGADRVHDVFFPSICSADGSMLVTAASGGSVGLKPDVERCGPRGG